MNLPSFVSLASPSRFVLLVLPLLLFGPRLAAQDSLQLSDGRFVVDKRMSVVGDGVVVHFEHGDVKVPKTLVKACTSSGTAEKDDWTPDERAKLDKGLVLFEGKWVPKDRRDKELERRRAQREERITKSRELRLWRNHAVLKTKNFEFHFTIDPDVMEGYAELMETYFREFTREWGITKPPKVDRLTVCFYHDEEYFHEVGGASEGVIGFYRFVEPRELNFFYDRLDQDMTVDVMFHETNHYLTHLIDLKFHYPPWVNESLAEYYGASQWDPEAKKMTVGNLQEGRLAVIQDAIKSDEWQGLEDLIRIEQGQFNGLHYAWGWSFVHFLLSNPRYAKGFKSFYMALAREKTVKRVRYFYDLKQVEADEQIRVLKASLRVDDLATLEKEWHDYVKGMQAASHRGYTQAGHIALARGMPIKAQRLFKTAIEMGSTDPRAHYGYGRALEQKGKRDEALAQYDRAIAIDPLEGMFYVRKAECLGRGDDKTNEKEIERLFALAEEIAPDAYDVILAKAMWQFRGQ